MKYIIFTLMLLFSMNTASTTPPGHPVQPYVNWPQPGYYVLKNHDAYNAYQCWVRFPDGYTLTFVLYPLVVTNPYPLITDFGCY